MPPKTVAILHPGDMGAAVGACLAERGMRVVFASSGRGPATRSRARDAALEDRRTLANALRVADIVISVCPPHGALALARDVARQRFGGIYVDANAVSPQTARRIGRTVASGGASFVDGGIVGPPPPSDRSTRLYLSGERAAEIASLFAGTPLQAIVLDARDGAASALKTCYAAWTKGATALLAAIRALARQEDVEGALLSEWKISQPGLERRSESITLEAHKAWRWKGEMDEIASAFEAVRLPGGFHRSAGEIYRRLDAFKGADAPPALTEVIEVLRARPKHPRPPRVAPRRTRRR